VGVGCSFRVDLPLLVLWMRWNDDSDRDPWGWRGGTERLVQLDQVAATCLRWVIDCIEGEEDFDLGD
jgi:hypothetical protein